MSLQIGFNEYKYISPYSKYGSGVTETSGKTVSDMDNTNEQTTVTVNSQEAKLMKKMGVVECTTCQNRKYVDGSDDPAVSFKAPAHVSPESSGAAVAAHEQEHVSRERSNAQMEGRKVVAQSVQIYTDVCPECGKVYTSGGKTTTTTKADSNNTDYFMDNMKKFFGNHFGRYIDLRL